MDNKYFNGVRYPNIEKKIFKPIIRIKITSCRSPYYQKRSVIDGLKKAADIAFLLSKHDPKNKENYWKNFHEEYEKAKIEVESGKEGGVEEICRDTYRKFFNGF